LIISIQDFLFKLIFTEFKESKIDKTSKKIVHEQLLLKC